MSERAVRVGIVGTGGWASAHARAFAAIPGVELEACCDLDEDRAKTFADEHAFATVCTTVRDLAARVDAASIVTSDPSHASISIELLEAGVHTLCEKPLATTLADAQRVAQTARSAEARGIVHMINFTKRALSSGNAIIEIARSGALGEITHAIGGYQQSWLIQDAWGHWTEPAWLWRTKRPGGALVDIGVHMLDLLTAAVGPPARLRCDLRTLPKVLDGTRVSAFEGEPIDADDIATQEIELAAGGFALLQQSRWAGGRHNREWLEISGTEGAAWVDFEDHRDLIWVCLGGEAIRARRWERRPCAHVPSNQARFIDAIRAREQVEPDMVRGAEVQAMLDACQRSARSGQWETPAAV